MTTQTQEAYPNEGVPYRSSIQPTVYFKTAITEEAKRTPRLPTFRQAFSDGSNWFWHTMSYRTHPHKSSTKMPAEGSSPKHYPSTSSKYIPQ